MKSRHLRNTESPPLTGWLFSCPKEIIKDAGCLATAAEAFAKAGLKTALLAGPYVTRQYGRQLKAGHDILPVIFGGETTSKEFYRVKSLLADEKINALIAAGGGKTMDLAKLVKRDLPGLKLACVPTSTATCAAATGISVMYDKNGVYADTVDSTVPDMLVIDYDVFETLPFPFYAAGIADTLAKYYETAAFIKQKKGVHAADRKALKAAAAIKNKLLKMIVSRRAENMKKELTDILIVDSGAFSCRNSVAITGYIAHAFAHAITVSAGAREFLHGEHAGLGLLVQASMLGNEKEAVFMEEILAMLDIPARLSKFNVTDKDMPEICALFERICKRENINLAKGHARLAEVLQRYM